MALQLFLGFSGLTRVVKPEALQFDLTLDIWTLPEPIVFRSQLDSLKEAMSQKLAQMMEDVKMKEGLSQVRRAGYFCRMMKVGVVEPGGTTI